MEDIVLDEENEKRVAAYMADKKVDRNQALNQLIYLGNRVHKVHQFGYPTRLVSAGTSFLVKPFDQGPL
ncbi:hypothetical protein [Nocardia sp. NPDC057030]|uniref:hypothetical protein n=1 Tax=unclassified Nocardia TaxID=2637762 RepID=UPI00362FFF47